MDQKLLEDFLSLCRHRSFSHAAQERNVTQPAFSRRIRALEEWLGVVLFDRTALPVRLTAQGEQFLPVARDIVARMLRNLKEIHRTAEDWPRLLAVQERLVRLLPELGLDAQAFLRSWIALGEELLARDSRRDDQSQEVQRLRRQIEQLSAIDEQLNQRKLNGGAQP